MWLHLSSYLAVALSRWVRHKMVSSRPESRKKHKRACWMKKFIARQLLGSFGINILNIHGVEEKYSPKLSSIDFPEAMSFWNSSSNVRIHVVGSMRCSAFKVIVKCCLLEAKFIAATWVKCNIVVICINSLRSIHILSRPSTVRQKSMKKMWSVMKTSNRTLLDRFYGLVSSREGLGLTERHWSRAYNT